MEGYDFNKASPLLVGMDFAQMSATTAITNAGIASLSTSYLNRAYDDALKFVYSHVGGVPCGLYHVRAKSPRRYYLKSYIDGFDYCVYDEAVEFFDAIENSFQINIYYNSNSAYCVAKDRLLTTDWREVYYQLKQFKDPSMVEGGANKLLRGEETTMNFKVGDKVKVLGIQGVRYGGRDVGYIGIVTSITLSKDPMGDIYYLDNGNGSYAKELKLLSDKNSMPNTDEIPKTLSVMERVMQSKDNKTLIKAGYMAGGEYTQKAKDLAIVLFLETQATKLVELAQEELDEAKAEK